MRRLAPLIIYSFLFAVLVYTGDSHGQRKRTLVWKPPPAPSPTPISDPANEYILGQSPDATPTPKPTDDFFADIPDAKPTPAPEWNVILEHTGVTFAYNTRRVTHPSPNIVRVWLKKRLSGNIRDEYLQRMGQHGYDYSGYIHTVSQEDFDCREFRRRDLYVVDYDRTGKRLFFANREADRSNKWVAVVPRSVAEYILNVVCKLKE